MNDMTQLLHSMERSMKLQNRARAEQEKREFQEKLLQAEASKIELDGMASSVKGKQDAVQRDQLISMMMGGF